LKIANGFLEPNTEPGPRPNGGPVLLPRLCENSRSHHDVCFNPVISTAQLLEPPKAD
jgi:hypothetical protein